MPLTKGDNIENDNKKKNAKKITSKKITDKEISAFFESEAKNPNYEKSFEQIKHETFHLVQNLHEMEIRLSEHFEIDAFEARFPNSMKRRKSVFNERSILRSKISENLRFLIETGMNEIEIKNEMPFIPKREVKGLILNEP
jgi:hypothetical protein